MAVVVNAVNAEPMKHVTPMENVRLVPGARLIAVEKPVDRTDAAANVESVLPVKNVALTVNASIRATALQIVRVRCVDRMDVADRVGRAAQISNVNPAYVRLPVVDAHQTVPINSADPTDVVAHAEIAQIHKHVTL